MATLNPGIQAALYGSRILAFGSLRDDEGGMIKDELIHFAYSMNQLIALKIPLIEALKCCATNMKSLRRTITNIISELENGTLLSDALKNYPKIFDPLFIRYIALSEQTGANYFHQIYIYLQTKQAFQKRLQRALIYPAFILGFLFVLLYTLSQFLLPELMIFLTEQNKPIPTLTYVLVMFTKYAPYGLGFMLLGLYGCIKSDYLILKIPFFGRWIQKYYVSLYFKITALFLQEKIPLTDALTYANSVIVNRTLHDKFAVALQGLDQGQHFYDVIPYEKDFIRMAEEYGFLEEGLEKLSVIKEKEVNDTIDLFIKILEPALIVILGGVIFMIVMAIWGPLYEVS
ncbi:MAG: type II secretion system F family protein [Alphaproteobacteria bacterium]|nr:MAG: type II secretion system F family protein [Alphaproteobacteria bacterium]